MLRPTSIQVGCLIAVIMAFYITAVRDGHNWGGDFSQYILHAQNVLKGHVYTDIGVDSKPDSPLGPKGYPPAYPISMVPVLALFGLNFVALKIQIVFYLGLGLFFYWFLLRDHLPTPWALGTLLFVSLSPWTLKFSNNILSDIPFFAASMAAIWSIERFFKHPPALSHASLVALLLLTACLFRSVGLVIIIAFIFYTITFRRSHTVLALLISGSALLVTTQIYQVCGSGGSYASQFATDPTAIAVALQRNIFHLKRSLVLYLAIYPSRNEHDWLYIIVNNAALISILALSIWGGIRSFRKRGLAIWDIYIAGYIGLLMIYPYPIRSRYLIPIVPFVAIYTLIGFRLIWANISRRVPTMRRLSFKNWHFFRLRYFLPVLIYMPIFFAYWAYFSFYPASPGANILKDPDTAHLFDEISNSKADISGIFFWRPRVLHLFTGARTAGFYNLNEVSWHQLTSYAKEYNMSHIVLDAYNTEFNHLIEGHQKHFESVYQNKTFSMYKIADITNLANTKP